MFEGGEPSGTQLGGDGRGVAARRLLAAAVQAVAAIDLDSVDPDDLAELTLSVERLRNAVDALSAEALAVFDRRGRWADEGALSAERWVAARTGTPLRSLRAQRRAGAALRALPAARSAARDGRLSSQHTKALAACVEAHPARAAEHEAVLVDQALGLDVEAFAQAARYWRCLADDAADTGEPRPDPAGDFVHLTKTPNGRWRLAGELSDEDGALLCAALEASVDRQLRAARDGDPSVGDASASTLRASALVDLAAQAARREPGARSVPDRYRVAVVIDHDTRDWQLPFCDSAAFRVTVGAEGEVLDVGRLEREWPAAIRRAITHRDGGCVFPGCDRPPGWTDVHHCHPWEDGGRTCVDNGALLCRRHHTFIHAKGWTVAVEDRTPIVRRPDGRPYEVRRWLAA